MQVIVLVRNDVAASLHQRQLASRESEELLRTAQDLGVVLTPMHPGTDDPNLAKYFVITVPDAVTAERVIARFRQSTAVESVYLKPREEVP